MTGSGTLLDPFIIWDVTDLQNMELDLTAYYELGQDIDASGVNFQPVGGWGGAPLFTGSFNGKRFTISHLAVNRPADNRIGLFGETYGTTIKNVTLEGSALTGDSYVGTLAGAADISTFTNINIINTTVVGADNAGGLGGQWFGGTVTNCHSSGSVGSGYNIGGLLGYADESGGGNIIITDCHSSCAISATDSLAGGLIGEAEAVTLLRCYATGNVSSSDDYIGGLCGWIVGGTASRCFATGKVTSTNVGGYGAGGLLGSLAGPITDCYSTGDVTAANLNDVGGLIGQTWNGGVGDPYSPSIVNCYSTGLVSGTNPARTGGFIGYVDTPPDQTTTTNCFWDNQTSGTVNGVVGGNRAGVTGLTTAEMVAGEEFAIAGWLQNIWRLGGGYYPCLIGVSPSCAYSPIPYPPHPIPPTPPWPPWPPPPPPPPIVTAEVSTLPATNIAENHATLNGVLTDSLARYGEVRFQYGVTSAYGMNTPWQDGFFTGDDFYANIVNVGEGSVYHFRAQFRGSPIVSGSDMTFSTLSSLGPVTMVSEELMQLLEG